MEAPGARKAAAYQIETHEARHAAPRSANGALCLSLHGPNLERERQSLAQIQALNFLTKSASAATFSSETAL